MKMKPKLKPVKLSAKRAARSCGHAVVPLRERRLTFGGKWDYAPAPEESKNYVIAPRHELFINGKFVPPPSTARYFPSLNPATEEKLTDIALAGEADVDRAVKAARRAYDKVWGKMPGRERGKYLYRIARIIQEKSRELAVLETMDGGKTIKESRDVDLPLVAAHFFYHAGWADKLDLRLSRPHARSRSASSARSSRGISRCSWPRGKSLPPSPAATPSSSSPPRPPASPRCGWRGFFRRRNCPKAWSTSSPARAKPARPSSIIRGINKIAFTGSTEVGKIIAKAVAGTGKKLTLELGGKAANIIFEDAPIDQAVEGIISGIYFNQGHVCCAGSRLLVQEGVFPHGHPQIARPHPDPARRQSAR